MPTPTLTPTPTPTPTPTKKPPKKSPKQKKIPLTISDRLKQIQLTDISKALPGIGPQTSAKIKRGLPSFKTGTSIGVKTRSTKKLLSPLSLIVDPLNYPTHVTNRMVPFPAVDIDDDEDEDDKNWGGDGSTITSVIDFTPRRVELKSGRVVRLGNLYDNEEGPLEIKGTVVDVHRDGTTLATDNIVTLSWFFGGPRSGEHSSSTSKSERAKIGVQKLLPQRVAGNIATDDAYHYYRVVSGRIRRSVACDGKSWDVTFPAPDFVLNFEGGGREFLLTMSGRVGDFVGDVCSELLSKDSTFAGLMPVYEGSGGVKQGVAVRLSLVEMFKILSPITDSCSVVRYFDDLFDSCANRLFEQAGTQATAQNLLEAVVNSSTHSRNELLGFSIYRIHNPRAPTGLTEITLDYDASKKVSGTCESKLR